MKTENTLKGKNFLPEDLSVKGSALKGKNLLPKFFPLRVDPLSEWRLKYFDRVVSPERVSVTL